MFDPKELDALAQRLATALPEGLKALQEDLGRNLRGSLEAGLSSLDLVNREEFDVQSAVLARTREKVARLEAQVAELERMLDRAPGDRAQGDSAHGADRSAGPGWAD